MASNPQHEPTMEEILASIRKIISEDSNESETKVGEGAEAEDIDVLELTRDDVVEESVEVLAAKEPARVMQMPGIARQEASSALEPVEQSQPNPGPVIDDDRETEKEDGIFSETTRKAMHDAFAKIDREYEEVTAEPTVETPAPEGSSVQAVFEHAVREKFGPIAASYLRDHADQIVEQMKPIIREWMDEHFPAILEGAVRNEVERAVRASAAYKPPRR